MEDASKNGIRQPMPWGLRIVAGYLMLFGFLGSFLYLAVFLNFWFIRPGGVDALSFGHKLAITGRHLIFLAYAVAGIGLFLRQRWARNLGLVALVFHIAVPFTDGEWSTGAQIRVGALFALWNGLWFYLLYRKTSAPALEPTRAEAPAEWIEHNPFQAFRARSVFGIMLLSLIIVATASHFVSGILVGNFPDYWVKLNIQVAFYVCAATGLVLLSSRSGISLSRLFRSGLEHKQLKRSALLVPPLLIAMLASTWVVYLPLSYFAPRFVTEVVLSERVVIWSDGTYPLLANVMNALSLIVIAPVVEEFIFRGLLLNRWVVKWGGPRAILASSVLFGIVHVEILGHILFGYAMSILYLETRSLLAPILAHALNNFLALTLDFIETMWRGPDYIYTVTDFRSEWWVGAVCLAIALPWGYRFLRSTWAPSTWRDPYNA